MGVVVDHPVTLVKLGNLKDPIVILACFGFCNNDRFRKLKVKGNIIIGILVFSIIAWVTGLGKFNGVIGRFNQ